MPKKSWTPEDIEKLKNAFPFISWPELCVIFAPKTIAAIRAKATEVGLQRLVRDPPSPELKAKKIDVMRQNHWKHTGKYHPPSGWKMSNETKVKLSLSRKGQRNSPRTEFKKGQRASPGTEFKKGHKPWAYGRKFGPLSDKIKEKLSASLKGKNKGKKRPDFRLHRFVGWGPANPFYGKHHTEEVKAKIRAMRKQLKMPKAFTKPEQQFAELCNKYNLPFKYVGDGQLWIGDINPDFVDVSGRRVAVEIFGDFWHTPLFRQQAIRDAYTEKGRAKTLKKYGWKLIVIWESTFHLPNAEERILGQLRRAGKCVSLS